ncbi:tail specific protease [Fadolivirus algeromassiliense]|jgi:hypothetical protein|uniref:Tail specific protease n=1 Tax=Fadolivirus FV1/VV64 TaxID=3070911 RepID=A0A7D3V595_9VIRU|nr:tail specific protease [Fadolivirus algeromassiliense]QKF93492.1 tail specific protease [Fadolivirus FV1/VV64]
MNRNLRHENESRKDFVSRLVKESNRGDVCECRPQNFVVAQQKLKSKQAVKSNSKSKQAVKNKSKSTSEFDFFVGFWLLDSCEDWNHFTLFELYKDSECNPRCRFYDGTQNHLREVNANDNYSIFNPVSPIGDDIEVEVLGPRSLRFVNNDHYTTDDLRSTMKIQDGDDNSAVCQFFTDWDGSADDPAYGSVENVSIFKRLPVRPEIQMNHLPSSIDWTNPVNIFNYVSEFFFYLGQPHKAVSLQQNNYLGWEEAEDLKNTFFTTGITRTATVSDKNRAGKYIGVWKTQFPGDFPVTTIHTQEYHHMNAGSTVHIHGFKGAFKVLNGVHKVSALPPSFSLSTPEPWQLNESREHYIHVDVDTSNICEDYDPCKHGVATIEAHHGPVRATTGYRDFFAALYDYCITVWGPGTHSRLRAWINENFLIPDTFDELKSGIANGDLFLLTNNFRTYTANHSANVYHNPYVVGGNLRFPEVNLNDPFGLGEMAYDEKFNYDIDIKNYLCKDKTYSLFFTVTGPTNPDEPLSEILTDLELGYPSNGTQVVFKVNTWGVFPEPLVDEYGTHEWRLFGAVDNDPATIQYQLHHNYVFGVIDKKYTKRRVGYIRIGDEDSFDSPYLLLSTRSLAFGRADMPNNKMKSNSIIGLATCIAKLNEHQVDKIIIDMRDNGGGFAHLPSAYGVPFGGNRIGFRNAIGFPGNGNRNPLDINGSGLQTANDSLQQNNTVDELINVDELAAIFPEGVFRGTECHKKEVILLTNSHAASAGDMLPHSFIGPDPNSTVHDLGHNVFARIIGDIDGRLWSGVKAYDGLALDPLNHNLWEEGEPRSAVYPATEAGLLNNDRHGTLVNEQPWTRPNVLLPTWYDKTVWQDLGLIKPLLKYPLCKHKKGLPKFNDPKTWRDVHLEYAIKH